MDRLANLVRRAAIIFLAVSATFSPAFAGETCQLRRLASLDGDFTGNAILVPIKLNGEETHLKIDTGGFWSFIRESLVTKAGYHVRSLLGTNESLDLIDVGGNSASRYAIVPTFDLGGMSLKNREFIIMPDAELSKLPVARFGGTFGQNFLQGFDLEVDPAQNRVNFFLSSDCASGAVYWNSSYFQIPFKRINGLLYVTAKIDGKEVQAAIDTGSSISLLDLETAHRLFNIELTDEDRKGGRDTIGLGGKKQKVFGHGFEKLDIGDVSFNNLTFGLTDLGLKDASGLSLIIGMDMLKHLHIYIPQKESVIYATMANERDRVSTQ